MAIDGFAVRDGGVGNLTLEFNKAFANPLNIDLNLNNIL